MYTQKNVQFKHKQYTIQFIQQICWKNSIQKRSTNECIFFYFSVYFYCILILVVFHCQPFSAKISKKNSLQMNKGSLDYVCLLMKFHKSFKNYGVSEENFLQQRKVLRYHFLFPCLWGEKSRKIWKISWVMGVDGGGRIPLGRRRRAS